jgi:hypothetical protein
MEDFFYLLLKAGLISYYLPFLFVLYLLLKKGKQFTSFERLLFFFIIYNGIAIIIEQFVLTDRITNFNPIFNSLTIIDFCTIIAIFSKILHEAGPKILTLLNFFTVICLSICFIELLFVNDLFSINIYTNSISKCLIIVVASITIYLSEIKITISQSQKIVTYTVFAYSILTLPISLFEQIIRHEKSDYLYIIWSLNILFAIFFNLFLTLSLWKLKR